METAKNIAWAKFWEERGRSYPDDDPIAIDGWDYGISQMGLEQAEELRKQISRELALTPQSKFLEVGCGAGMFLGPLSESVQRAVGCDLSESMVMRAWQINNKLKILVSEANNLPYASNEFDAILVYSVFHYFPSNDYAKRALRELYRVCRNKGRIWIGDVPDKSRQEQALLHRERLMKQTKPKWPWPNLGPLEQRFYEKVFFVEFCERVGCKHRIVPQSVEGYVQGKYRYNVFIEKI
jgi:ubiquinone/menaquinone biosynthesis C-methylase UbiE